MTPPPIDIRFATEDDLPGIFEIYDEQVLHGTATFETVPKTQSERVEWYRNHPPHRSPLVVATVNGMVIGWAGLSPWSPRAAYARSAENSVYVHKDWRGRGLGEALMADLMERARAAGVKVLIARLVEGNAASVRLHESLGFTTIGVMRRVGEKFGRILDVRLMQAHLDEGPR
jgi:L-amino acid N-acyltransferase YncA